VFAAAWLGYAGALCVLATVPRLVGWDARAVVSGSMAPAVPTGSVVLAGPVHRPDAELPVGTIVVVPDPAAGGRLCVHRIVARDDEGLLVTRGDANPWPDVTHVRPEQVAGRVRAVVPVAGWPLVWWQRHRWTELAAGLTLAWLGVVLVVRGRPDDVVSTPVRV